MKPNTPKGSDAQLDSAFSAERDAILPSSGFADSVMSAVHHAAHAPDPIPFPWKRALPGLVLSSAGLLVLLTAALMVLIHFLRTAPAAAAGSRLVSLPQMSWLHALAAPDILWPLASLALALACILPFRRLIFAR